MNDSERRSLSPRRAAEPQDLFAPRQLLSVSETLDIGLWTLDIGPWTLDLFSVNCKIFRFRVMGDDRGSRLLRLQLKLFSQFYTDPSGVE